MSSLCISTYTTLPCSTTHPTAFHILYTQITNTRHDWQNGTECRDGMKVLCMVSFPSSLVGFWGFHSYMQMKLIINLGMACQKVCKQGSYDVKVKVTIYKAQSPTSFYAVVAVLCAGWGFVYFCFTLGVHICSICLARISITFEPIHAHNC